MSCPKIHPRPALIKSSTALHEDIFKSLYDPNIDGYSFQLRDDIAKARQIYKLSDNISDDVIGNVLEQRWRNILTYPKELTVQEVPEEIA